MRLAVLCSPDSWYWGDLQRAAAGRDELVRLAFSTLSGSWSGSRSRVAAGQWVLDDFDAVLVRTMPPGSLDQVVFRMDLLGRLQEAGQLVVNPPRCLETAVDKYLSTAKLAAAGLQTPRTCVCQTAADALAAFAELGGDVVVKPLFGGEGRGILRVSDGDLARRVFHTLQQLQAVIYVQQFIAHEGYDVRLFVLGERVFGMRRLNPHDWRTNVSRGAQTEPWQVAPSWEQLARAAADAVGAVMAGVDVLPARDGQRYVLEVNAVPGWKALSRTLGLDMAALVLDYLRSSAGLLPRHSR